MIGRVVVPTSGKGLHEFTHDVQAVVDASGIDEGLCTLMIQHTSASLTIQENADPSVQRDLADALDRMAPESHAYAHASEGPDDMPAHIKAMVTSTSLSIPVSAGRALLGTWQGLYLVEHRRAPHRREVLLRYQGTFR